MTEAELLAWLPSQAFAFALVLSRVGMAVMLLPGLGEAGSPAIVRAGFVVALSALLLPIVSPLMPPGPAGAFDMAAMVAAELFCGGVLGTLARLTSLSLGMAGAFISYLMGLSSVIQTDPALGGQSAALGRLFGLVAPVVILSAGLYVLPLSALAGSYRVVAPGAWLPAGNAADSVVQVAAAAFGLAVRLAAPLLIASVVWQAALGLLARLAPQLQFYASALPGQIVAGVALLGLLALRVLDPWEDALRTAWRELPGQ